MASRRPTQAQKFEVDTPNLEAAAASLSTRIESSLQAIQSEIKASKPSKIAEVREWVIASATFAAIVAVGFSWFSLRATIQSSEAENQRARYQTLSERIIDADAIFVEQPQLIPYFFDSKSPDTEQDPSLRSKVEATAVRRVDTDEYVYTNLLSMKDIPPPDHRFVFRTPDGPSNVSDDWLAWSEAITGHFRDSPAMCAVVLDPGKQKSYGAAFITALAESDVCPGLVGYTNF
ncbi:hypothetical protein HZU40_22460 [Mycolicibacterium fluoranthenivorans]|uniref:Uncharacterized protein n=1 Tax=Mycolicibacterium fluoranthenivorans TaxID=258505 RepID=A0A7G8P9G2_9MYCO|nr:hypothetical protein [Mycolicibacterium fluoranthenivorans]QNJ90978.1 hypothetical protein HZU40_22460 [Mycolicibacterium fluoranthenivorans]